jgi:hypothetical protein
VSELHKYPRTQHLEGSRLQPGDEDLAAVPFAELRGRPLVVEEKMDGANAALSFTPEGELRLQSRGHFLVGGERERHFDLFKRWASTVAGALRDVLRDRYVLYGEWLYAKHTIFYDRLPHYFMEFDVLDLERGCFLDTPSRRELLRGLPLVSVRVLASERFSSLASLRELVGPSAFIAEGHLERLRAACLARGLDPARAQGETDPSLLMEGLYLKLEEEGEVRGRYKLIRASFLQSVLRAEGHWLDRPILPNQLAPGARIDGCSPATAAPRGSTAP